MCTVDSLLLVLRAAVALHFDVDTEEDVDAGQLFKAARTLEPLWEGVPDGQPAFTWTERRKAMPQRLAVIVKENPLGDRACRRRVTAKLPAVEELQVPPLQPIPNRKPHQVNKL